MTLDEMIKKLHDKNKEFEEALNTLKENISNQEAMLKTLDKMKGISEVDRLICNAKDIVYEDIINKTDKKYSDTLKKHNKKINKELEEYIDNAIKNLGIDEQNTKTIFNNLYKDTKDIIKYYKNDLIRNIEDTYKPILPNFKKNINDVHEDLKSTINQVKSLSKQNTPINIVIKLITIEKQIHEIKKNTEIIKEKLMLE